MYEIELQADGLQQPENKKKIHPTPGATPFSYRQKTEAECNKELRQFWRQKAGTSKVDLLKWSLSGPTGLIYVSIL